MKNYQKKERLKKKKNENKIQPSKYSMTIVSHFRKSYFSVFRNYG